MADSHQNRVINHILHIHGSPVFYGKVTAQDGMSPSPTNPSNHAEFYGGWEIGVDIPVPTDMTYIVTAATASNGAAATNTMCLYDQETTFDFQSDGSVIRTVGAGAPDTVLLSTIAPDGIIYCSDNIRVKGTLNGQVSLYSGQSIYIDNDIVYDKNDWNTI